MSFRSDMVSIDLEIFESVADDVQAIVGGAPIDTLGVFDEEFVRVEFDGAASAESTGPACALRETDVPGIAHGDTIDPHNGNTYSIVELQPDGMGLVWAILTRN